MREHYSDFGQGSASPWRPGGEGTGAPRPRLEMDRSQQPTQALGLPLASSDNGRQGFPPFSVEAPAEDPDGPTNIYYLAHYTYQLSISAVSMSDHELGLLLPRSGRIWFNARIFTDVPHGHEFAQRDAWWRAIDASPAVRFLLGWSVCIYRTAQFHHIARDQMPGWSRILYFSPPLAECSRVRVQFWSNVIQDVTNLFVPAPRVWRQIQTFTTFQPGDRYWQSRLALAGHKVSDAVQYLADRNSCPPILIERALDGNPPIESYEEYQRFSEALLEGLPRLSMQRVIAMQRATSGSVQQQQHGAGEPASQRGGRLQTLLRDQWFPEMADPRQDIHFWQLHL